MANANKYPHITKNSPTASLLFDLITIDDMIICM